MLALAGCGDLRDDLGLGRTAPDEFAVVDRPPLSVPPDFSLRPPQPGAPRPQEVDMTKRANTILFGADEGKATSKVTTGSKAEKALLVNSGADHVDPNIREVIDREAAEKVVGNRHLVNDLLWWRKDDDGATTVDATAEAARIKQAKEKGESLTQGATPIIERQKSGWLGL
ncbi:MAG: DUF3035 domain-containing protein [Bdellovibrionales bacterium]